MKAYVLAAGYATRMYPLTRDVPKTLLEVGGRPILDHIMDRVRALEDVTHVTVVTNARFAPQFAAWAQTQPASPPLTLVDDGTTSDAERLGAVADLRLAIERVPLRGEEALVVAGDNLFDFDLGGPLRAFRKHGRTTLLVRNVTPPVGPSPYNEVTMDADGRVTRFREKPARTETDLSAIALYVFPPAVLASLDEYLVHGNRDAPGHFIAWVVERFPCEAIPVPGRWFDIGSIESLERARRDWRC